MAGDPSDGGGGVPLGQVDSADDDPNTNWQPSTTGTSDAGTQVPFGVTDIMDPLAGSMPSPADAPDLYQTLIMSAPPPNGGAGYPDGTTTTTVSGGSAPVPAGIPSAWIFPAEPKQGVAVVEIKRSLKKDDKTAVGRKKAKTTVTGTNSNKGTIRIQYSSRIFAATESWLMDIDPNGPYAGGPFASGHPEFLLSRTSAFMIDEVGERKKVEGSPFLYERTLTISEWVPPEPAVGAGGVTTPPAADAPPTGAPGYQLPPPDYIPPRYGGPGSPDANP